MRTSWHWLVAILAMLVGSAAAKLGGQEKCTITASGGDDAPALVKALNSCPKVTVGALPSGDVRRAQLVPIVGPESGDPQHPHSDEHHRPS